MSKRVKEIIIKSFVDKEYLNKCIEDLKYCLSIKKKISQNFEHDE